MPRARKEGVMNKRGKSGLGRTKKTAQKSQQMARGRLRLALAAAAESKKAEGRDRRRCAKSVCFLNCRQSARDGAECSIPHFHLHRLTASRRLSEKARQIPSSGLLEFRFHSDR